MNDKPDKKVLACNYAEATRSAVQGALCFICNTNPGNGGERIEVLVRSRGGRWIRKWEPLRRLTNFRYKTLPASHPLYSRYEIADYLFNRWPDIAEAYNREAERLRCWRPPS